MVLATQLIFVVVLARLLQPAELGLYGLVVATVGFSVLLIGGDFYTFVHRELLSAPPIRRWFFIQHHLIAILFLYLLFIPLHGLIFWGDLLPVALLSWFFTLLIGQHLSAEIYRLLIVLDHQLSATVVLALRAAVWVWVFVPLAWLGLYPVTLQTVFAAWTAGVVLSIIVGSCFVFRVLGRYQVVSFDIRWLKRGFKVGTLFLLATILLRLLFAGDRYVAEYLGGPDYLGVYVLYSSISMALLSFVDPAVFAFLYPSAVRAYRSNQLERYREVMREMTVTAGLLSGVLAVTIGLISPFVLEWTGREIYVDNIWMLWLLLAGSVMFVMSMIPHYALYSKSLDKPIVMSHVFAVGIFLVVVFALGSSYREAAVPLGVVIAMAVIWISKSVMAKTSDGG